MSQSLPERHSLHTERLHLEILHKDHADEMFSVLRNPIIYRYMDGRPISWHTWIMREKRTNAAIGYIQATLNHAEKNAELAWVLSPLWTGKRYSSEAARRVIQELRHGGLVSTFTCTIDKRNAPSQHLAQSLGFAISNPLPVESQTWTLISKSIRE